MTLPTHRISRCIVLGILCALLTPLPSYASEQPIETFYADRFERLTGYPPTEEGVRSVLALFETRGIHPTHRYAAISVVGERKLTGLVDDLKAIYHRQPEDVPLEFKFLYKSPGAKDRMQALIARALVRCGDNEGKSMILEHVKRSDTMMGGSAVFEAGRNLKYLVKEFGTDVSKELEFLFNRYMNIGEVVVGGRTMNLAPFGRRVVRDLYRELFDIKRYTDLTVNLDHWKYVDLIQKIDGIHSHSYFRPRWPEIYRIEKELGMAARGHPNLSPEPMISKQVIARGESTGDEFTVFLETPWGLRDDAKNLPQETVRIMAQNRLNLEVNNILRREMGKLKDIEVVEDKRDAEFWLRVSLTPASYGSFVLLAILYTRAETKLFLSKALPANVDGWRFDSGGMVFDDWKHTGSRFYRESRYGLELACVNIASILNDHVFELLRERARTRAEVEASFGRGEISRQRFELLERIVKEVSQEEFDFLHTFTVEEYNKLLQGGLRTGSVSLTQGTIYRNGDGGHYQSL